MNDLVMEKREYDIWSRERNLEELYTIRDFPVYMGVTEQDRALDLCADMHWMISKKSGMIQLGKLLPPDILYSNSHNSPTGRLWKRHFEEFAEFIFRVGESKNVLEIGGGNGILNVAYQKCCIPDSWTIIDPTTVTPLEGCTASYIKGYWDKKFAQEDYGIDFDTVVHSHLLEHQYDVREFMESCESVMNTGQKMIFSLPDFKCWIQNKYSNALNFEHTYFISEEYLDELMREYNFRVIKKKHFGEGHSLFYAVEKVPKKDIRKNTEIDFRQLYEENKKSFNDYVTHFERLITHMNEEQGKAEGDIFLFGAHVFSQLLMCFGLDFSQIKCVLDNDPLKQGKRLYGTGLIVSSPQILKGKKKPVVILNAGAYSKEIKEDILKNINPSTIFVE